MITNINIQREDGQVTGITAYVSGQMFPGLTLNGSIPLEAGEFGNSLDLTKLEAAVKQKIINRLVSGDSPTEEQSV
ncbi:MULTISPECIES: hypothetical protein [Bhargavaea]|uniref:Uncharacterized protein n=1 Tax=Bhargavaea changchunensis TaxID=2134037 RepID=A0ABW2NF41_9BACL|nr:hypothetical protein [Bhargavaea sp. CC-171006]